MALWRGFGVYAVDLGLKVRSKLGLNEFDRLDVQLLAKHYNIPILGFDQIGCDHEVLRHLTATRHRKLSGFTIPIKTGFAVVTNPCHTEHRVRATIGHEFAHIILNHQFSVLLAGDEGCAFGSEDQEDEAKWFGAELLLPRAAAARAVRRNLSVIQVSDYFGVSVELARWRMNICGERTKLQRAGRRGDSKLNRA